MPEIQWNTIYSTLEKWRKTLNEQGSAEPSVTTVAERYSHEPWAVLVSTILSLRTKDEVTIW